MVLFNFKGKQNSISDALQLDIPEHAVISMVGAGGKTSLIFALAEELADSGKKVIVTTTTHMLHPEFAGDSYKGSSLIFYSDYTADESDFTGDYSKIDELLDKSGILLIASEDETNEKKITSPPTAILEYAYKKADAVLIEADGSRQMPLKWPKPHEPVVPECTDISICVAGMTSYGHLARDVIYGVEHMDERLLRSDVNESMIAAIVSSPDGGLKGTYGDYRIFLNQADDKELQEKAEYIQKLLAVRGMQSAWGSLK